ncbi:MAG: bifunctional demethylmenaquinone methyltransferase/2-methoxy-6-polyprenyl-1,4-benzoquinol methylase UbiE [Pseudomonadota bacterium]
MTNFGFETVTLSEKVRRVNGVFESVAPRYDLMNDLMSGGIHRLWKRYLIDRLAPRPGEAFLDVAGGTGDVAGAFLKRADVVARRRGSAKNASAVILDLNQNMLDAGQKRWDLKQYKNRLSWICGDAMDLPFEDNAFDALCISLGIRNVADRPKALSELRRVLKPGGRLAILELGHMQIPALKRAYDAYSFQVIPRMGKAITGDRASYQYLVESIRRFPEAETFKGEIETADFQHVTVSHLTGGIATLYCGCT